MSADENLIEIQFTPCMEKLQKEQQEAHRAYVAFGRNAIAYALWCLRMGATLANLKKECDDGDDYQDKAALALGWKGEEDSKERLLRTARRYSLAYDNFFKNEKAIADGKRKPEDIDDELLQLDQGGNDEIASSEDIDSEAIGVVSIYQKVNEMPVGELLLSKDFPEMIQNGRAAKVIFSRTRQILGNRGITSMYRKASVVPSIKEGTGTNRGKTGPTLRAERRRRMKMRERIVADIHDAIDSTEMMDGDWRTVLRDILPVLTEKKAFQDQATDVDHRVLVEAMCQMVKSFHGTTHTPALTEVVKAMQEVGVPIIPQAT